MEIELKLGRRDSVWLLVDHDGEGFTGPHNPKVGRDIKPI